MLQARFRENPSSASADISDVGLFATAGAVGVLLIDGTTLGGSHALETGVLGAEAMANSGVVYAVLQLIAERERPLQGTGQEHFFQTKGLDNSFPAAIRSSHGQLPAQLRTNTQNLG